MPVRWIEDLGAAGKPSSEARGTKARKLREAVAVRHGRYRGGAEPT